MSAVPSSLPLSGVRLLSVEQFGAGPFGTSLLADLGAEVVKIEDPRTGGDSARYTPPLTLGDGDCTYFQSFNRNKRSVAIDLADPRGRDVFRRLVPQARGVFNNLRGDLPERLGLTFEALRDVNPRVVCCSLSGFGSNGPRRAEPGYDNLVQALAGYMALTGDPQGPPAKCGVSVIDFSAGYAAVLGLVVALFDAERTGTGRNVEASLFDTAVHMLNYLAAWRLNDGYAPGRIADSGHPALVPAQNFATADGTIAVICFKEKFWERLCDLAGFAALKHDSRFARFPDRLANKKALLEILKPAFAHRTTAEWMALLAGKVPCAPVNDLERALADPQLAARDMIVEIPHPVRPLREVGSPVKVGGAEMPRRPAPRLGADTDAILVEAGYSRDEIASLRSASVVL